MALYVHVGDRPDGEPPRPLLEACERAHKHLTRVSLRVRRGRQGYKAIGRHVDVIQPGESDVLEGLEPSTAGEIAEKVWELAVDHATSHGPSYYQAEFFADSKRLERIAFSVSEGEDGLVESSESAPRENEIVDMARLSSQMAKDSHVKHMITMDKLTGMMDGFAKMADVHGKMHVEIARFEHEFRMKNLELQQQMDENEASVEKWKAGVSPMVAIGKQVGEVLGQFVLAKLSEFGHVPSDDPSSSRSDAIRSIWNESTTNRDLILKRLTDYDPELVQLWQTILKADDATVRNVWTVFVQRLRACNRTPKQAFTGGFADLEKILSLLEGG